MYWANQHDMDNHLLRTIVRYKGKAVKITRCYHEHAKVKIKHLRDGKVSKVNLSSLDLTSPPLGYVNGLTSFLRRHPRRRWRWGLDSTALGVDVGTCGEEMATIIADLIEGNYPNKEDAVSIEIRRDRVVISRNFLLSHGEVYYQRHPVGSYDQNLNINFENRFRFLRELQEIQEYVNN